MNTVCLRCHRAVEVSDEDAGELVRCPACRKQFVASPAGSVCVPKKSIGLQAWAWIFAGVGFAIAAYFMFVYKITYGHYPEDDVYNVGKLNHRTIGVEFGLWLCSMSTLVAMYKRSTDPS